MHIHDNNDISNVVALELNHFVKVKCFDYNEKSSEENEPRMFQIPSSMASKIYHVWEISEKSDNDKYVINYVSKLPNDFRESSDSNFVIFDLRNSFVLYYWISNETNISMNLYTSLITTLFSCRYTNVKLIHEINNEESYDFLSLLEFIHKHEN
jgi:hypothetical protein